MSPECTRVLDGLGQPLPPELAAHVASCEECRALREGFGALEGVPPVAVPALEPVRTRALEHVGPWLLLGGLALLVRSRLLTHNHAP